MGKEGVAHLVATQSLRHRHRAEGGGGIGCMGNGTFIELRALVLALQGVELKPRAFAGWLTGANARRLKEILLSWNNQESTMLNTCRDGPLIRLC
jgi:hypothetical protein